MRTNVTDVYFNGQETAAIFVHWQHDYTQVIRFADIDLPSAYEVDFANVGDKTSKTMIGNVNGVEIPDEYLTTGKAINAYIYLHDVSDSGETVRKVSIQVHGRPERTEEIPDPHQQSLIEQAIAALDAAVEQTAADVVTSGENAQAAADSAEAADEYADAAQGYASDASGYASSAQESAESAQGYAEDAEAAAGSVLGLTADATVDANVGTPSVEVEVTTESDHKNMSFAFHNLKGVQGDIGVGISSVVLNADYTLTINLTNGASYTTTSIRGEVGATPNLTIGTVTTLPEGSQATATITGTDEDPVLNLGIPVGDTGDPGISPTITVTSISGGHSVEVVDAQGMQTFDVMDGEVSEQDLEDALIDKADVITSTASGEIVTIADGGNDMPVVDLKLSLLPVQSGSGDPSPDNVRPISGWTGVDLHHTAENIFGGNLMRDGVLASMASATDDPTNRVVSFVSSAVTSQSITGASGLSSKFKPNTQYTLILTISKTGGGNGSNLRIYYTDGTYTNITGFNTTKSTTAVVTSAGKTVASLSKSNSGGTTYLYYDESGIFEGVLTADEFKPYVGNTYPIDWTDEAGTVYGGSLDVGRGVLRITHALNEYTKDTPYASSRTNADGVFSVLYILQQAGINSASASVQKSNALKIHQASNIYQHGTPNSIGLSNEGTSIRINADTSVTSIAEYLAWIDGIGTVQHWYPLATPVEYTLTPTQITTLLGTNNFWSNGNGVIDLEYRCDTKLYIEQLTKPSEDDMTANANIASGRFFMIGNRLMLSTTAIAQGEQIVVGTNCSEISLADALNQINA